MASFDFSTKGLNADLISSAGNIMLAQVYGLQLQEQQQISAGSSDVNIVIKAAAYQNRMVGDASFWQTNLLKGLIDFLGALDNCSALIQAFSSLQPSSYENFDKDTCVESWNDICDSISNEETAFSLCFSRFSLANDAICSLSSTYNDLLSSVISELSEEVKKTTDTIDTLIKDINNDISAIVNDGMKVGDAVKDLIETSIGVVSGDGSEKYSISGIRAVSDGAAGASVAASNLNLLNDSLSATYLKLADLDLAATLAKSIQVQNNLFSSAVASSVAMLNHICVDLDSLVTSFTLAGSSIKDIANPADYKFFKKALATAVIEWSDLSSQINYIKLALSTGGSLPTNG